MEIWKDIEGYEGLYKVSNLGNIKSLNYHRSGKERILKPGKDRYEYLLVKLYKEGKCKRFSVHRLVAQAFISNPDNLPQVNHKDEDKINNSIENLEWCDSKYNNNFGTRNQRAALNRINHPSLSRPVRCIETEVFYQSISEASRKTGIAFQNISSCCLGNRKTAGKRHWEFV